MTQITTSQPDTSPSLTRDPSGISRHRASILLIVMSWWIISSVEESGLAKDKWNSLYRHYLLRFKILIKLSGDPIINNYPWATPGPRPSYCPHYAQHSSSIPASLHCWRHRVWSGGGGHPRIKIIIKCQWGNNRYKQPTSALHSGTVCGKIYLGTWQWPHLWMLVRHIQNQNQAEKGKNGQIFDATTYSIIKKKIMDFQL